MKKTACICCSLTLALAGGLCAGEPPRYGAEDFVPTPDRPVGFRGDGSGIYAGATPPLVFSDKTNLLWMTPIPIVEKPGGWSHSPPVVVGSPSTTLGAGRVFISAEPDSTLCLDADTGKILWRDALGLLNTTTECLGMHSGNDFSTASSDGKALYRLFSGATTNRKSLAVLVSYDFEGNRRWLTKMTVPGRDELLQTDNLASPLLVADRLLVRIRHNRAGDLIAYHADTGKVAWGPTRYALDPTDGNPWGDGTDGGLVTVRLGPRVIALVPGGLCIAPDTGELLGRALTAEDGNGRKYNRLGFAIGGQWSVYNTPVARPNPDGSATVVFSGSDNKTFVGETKPGQDPTPVPPESDLSQDEWREKKFTGGIRVLACRLSLDEKGLVRSEPLWRQPASLVVRESGQLHPHASLSGERIALLHVKGQVGVVDLKTGRLLGKDFQPVYNCEYKAAHLKYDLDAPEVLAKNVMPNPVCFYSHAEPVPHGNRLYYRTWTRLYCFGEKVK